MCGIIGFWGIGDENVLAKMAEKTSYRGPDYTGLYFNNEHQLGLAHNRLSIIDLSHSANQPFFSNDKRFAIVFNGEIYNFQELKKELQLKGYNHFKTNGDTEVLLACYVVFGKEFVRKLNGMFSFAIYDFHEKKLFAARDRFGKKPFYYYLKDNLFIFASEPKAILEHPQVSKRLNLTAFNHYLTLDYIPNTLSIFENIQKLEGGHSLQLDNKRNITISSYYTCNFEKISIDFNEAKLELETKLNEATKIRMISDVPLGVFLSGGIDSSAIAYFAQKNSLNKIDTFSIGFDEKSYDERSYAALVSKQLGTNHQVMTLSATDSLNLIPTVFSKLDEPFADPSILPTYLLSNFTKSKVTVALGGDGSDEILSGYPTFISEKIIHSIPFLPIIKNGFKTFLPFIPTSDKNISLDFKLNQFYKGLSSSRTYRHPLWLGSFTFDNKKELINSNIIEKLDSLNKLSEIENLWNIENGNNITYQYIKTYLQDDILYKVDRASMYNSLEVRAPFLDFNVVNFANSLPDNFKLKGLSNVKYILKEVMRNKLPDEILFRPKKGFGIPLSLWLKNELKPLCEDLLSENSIKSQGLFNYKYIARLKDEHFKNKKNNRKELWNLLVFQMWYNSPWGAKL